MEVEQNTVNEKLSNNDIDGAISVLMEHNEKLKELGLHQLIVLKKAEFKHLKEEEIKGTLQNEELVRRRIKIIANLYEINSSLKEKLSYKETNVNQPIDVITFSALLYSNRKQLLVIFFILVMVVITFFLFDLLHLTHDKRGIHFTIGKNEANNVDDYKNKDLLNPKTTKDELLWGKITEIGLTDIKRRGLIKNQSVSTQIYDIPKRNILITGLTCYYTITYYNDKIKNLLDSGRDVYMIFLNPYSKDIPLISSANKVDVTMEINASLAQISKSGLSARKNFHLKLFDRIPQFTGIMIDGDIEPVGIKPNMENGILNIQPILLHHAQDKGMIFEFKYQNLKSDSSFTYFAEEFRLQWKLDAREIINKQVK